MYAASFATIVGLTLGLLSQTVIAREPLRVNTETPANYDMVKEDLDKIPDYLEASQCGGWDTRSVENTIATVSNVPGRNGVWNGAILTGMATRKDENNNTNIDDDFIFPNTTTGLTTACKPGIRQIPKKVWKEKPNAHTDEVEQVDKIFPHPEFTDPSCTWRRKNPDGTFESIAPSMPLKDLSEYDPAPDYGQLDQEPDNRQSPENCLTFCKMLNDYQYYDCLVPEQQTDPVTGEVYTTCKDENWGNKYLCSDQKVTDANGACTSNTGDRASSIKCVGAECRCQEKGPQPAGNQCVPNPGTTQEESPLYYSYYRKYQGSYTRDKVTTDDLQNDKESDSAEVACYGFYDEFDPKTHFTGKDPNTGISKDRRCVINIDVSGRVASQEGKGEYGQNSNFPDRDPNDDANQRTPAGQNRNPGDYDKNNDLWYLKLGGGFSLLSEQKFIETYDQDLSKVFLNLGAMDTGKMRATEQLNVRQPIAPGSYIRSFDDTGERAVVSWWQTQQTAVAEALHPPIIRMILPSGWAMGIDPNDPFFANPTIKVLKPAEKREDRMEVQINAEDDSLGAVLGYLQRSLLLHVVEEPVPALVPVGTATEFRAKAEAWCTWVMRRDNKQDCNDPPADVDKLMKTLDAYATDIEQYRLLRAELPKYASKVLNIQQEVTKPITDWMLKNVNAYNQYLADQKAVQATLGAEWRKAQEAYETFGSTTNLPWCMNQRFTLPVYSLLDDWLPARDQSGDRTADKLPVISAESNADIVIDLSAIAFMSGSISLPVLDPIQVRVTDFPSPPSPEKTKKIGMYPELPSITAIQDALKRSSDALPKPDDKPPVIPPIDLKPIDPAKTNAQKTAIQEAKKTIDKMDERYKAFWKSIGPFKPWDPAAPDADPDFDPDNKKGIAYKKPLLECETWDDNTCQHVEMDLRERFMRIASRPLVFLKEDYWSKDEKRGVGAPCVAQSDVCTPLHPEEGGEKHLWEIIGPKNIKETLEELRTDIRKATLPKPVGDMKPEDFPHYGTGTGNLLPPYDVSEPIKLFPLSSSSSSAQT